MNNTIVNDIWYLIYYENEEENYKAFIKRHDCCEMGNEIVYIVICDHDQVSYVKAMKFRRAIDAQLEIDYLAKQYSWFEKEKHKVVCCNISVDIIESNYEQES